MMQNVLHRRLRLHNYKIQILLKIKDIAQYKTAEFPNLMLNAINSSNNFSWQLMYADETTFHRNSQVNRRDSHTWRQKPPHEIYEIGETSQKFTWYVARDMTVLQSLSFLLKTLSQEIFTWIHYNSLSVHKLKALKKEKGMKLCFNNIVLHSTSVMRYKMP
jgi:hypothetical protein